MGKIEWETETIVQNAFLEWSTSVRFMLSQGFVVTISVTEGFRTTTHAKSTIVEILEVTLSKV